MTTEKYPVLALKNTVIFPQTIRPLFFSRPQSLHALEEAVAKQRDVFVVTLKNPDAENLNIEDMYSMGVSGQILKVQQLPNGAIQALFEAEKRGRLVSANFDGLFIEGDIESISTIEESNTEIQQMSEALKKEFFKYADITQLNGYEQWKGKLEETEISADQFADAVASFLQTDVEKLQELLETLPMKERIEKVYAILLEELQHKEFETNFRKKVENQINQKQKEYFLNEQMKAIQSEMGNSDSDVVDELEEKIKNSKLPKHVREVAEKELMKLRSMGNNSHEATPVRNYLDWLVDVPWSEQTEDQLSLDHATEVLDGDHFGLETVKERILEYLAVSQVVGKLKSPIIALSGPPGVGKTSLAKSVAKALGRKFARISLGGVRDEAEIRGHRRTYIGAMPGKLIQTMKKVGTVNPVILLDEIDKLSHSYAGSPAAALLEVLDPEQNSTFVDHYLEVEYDLSQVLFITTANNLSEIPLPLLDRMEIIELAGYTELEKTQIAQHHLLPKQMKENGLQPEQVQWSDEQMLHVIRSYTREAGVRSLDRTLSKVSRKAVTEIVKEKPTLPLVVDHEMLEKWLGAPKFRYHQMEEKNEAGMITGLAWTSVGGETLSIEVTTMKGHGKVQLTGKLGDVMKESAQAAVSYVRSHANALGIYSKVFDERDIHIHVPAGGTPKDGPSAGIAITTAIISAFTDIPVQRDVALTGEVTLRGKVLPIGGLKEKLLAAKRVGMNKVVIPAENERDLLEISEEIKGDLLIVPVKHVREVFPHLLEQLPVRVRDKENAPSASSDATIGQDATLPVKEYENYPSSNTNFS